MTGCKETKESLDGIADTVNRKGNKTEAMAESAIRAVING